MELQRCPKCEQSKPQADYHADKWGKPGHYCRPCVVEYKREWKLRRYGPPKVRTRKPKPAPAVRPLSQTYRAVHKRLWRTRGSASGYVCPCGQPAQEWSYDHSDPAPLRGTTPRGRAVTYSADLSRYQALCKVCHSARDATHV